MNGDQKSEYLSSIKTHSWRRTSTATESESQALLSLIALEVQDLLLGAYQARLPFEKELVSALAVSLLSLIAFPLNGWQPRSLATT